MSISGPVSIALAASALLLAGCGTSATGAGTTAEQSERLEVVTAFYPFQYLAQRVAGENATVTSLTQPGAEPHDLELTPKQVGSIGTADLVVYENTFQPAVDAAVTQSGAANVLDTATVVPMQPLSGADEHTEDEGHAEEEGHAAEEGHVEEEGHSHGEAESGLDPHVWLDPENMATIATEVARRLSALDPANAATYTANAEALATDLTGLDEAFRTGLATCERREFITTHTAFGYLASRYDLTQIGISGLSPDAEPSPARVAEVQREAKEHGVTTIFYETLVSPATAESIAGDLGLRTDVLDPIEGITEQSRGQDYLAVMQANLTALRSANGCS